MKLNVHNTTRTRLKVPFLEIKNDILGSGYELSVALVGEKRAREINLKSRNKSYAPNVLSFPLGKNAGELYLCPVVSNKEASNFGHTKSQHLTFLYIHGLLHLKGMDHGKKMEDQEMFYLKKYS